MDFNTRVVAPEERDTPDNAVSPPIFQTSAFAFHDVDAVDQLLGGSQGGYSYTRGGNPNFDALARFIAGLEHAEAAVVTASGTGALLAGILTLAPSPVRLLVSREIYGGTVGLSRRLLTPLGYRMEWVDLHDPAAVAAACAGPPAILLAESISNPLGRVAPLDEVIRTAHAASVPVMIDNTFATPFHAEPLAWGADVVVHSLTKFIGGHSDLILGVVAGSRDRMAAARALVASAGLTPDPFATWLALRGARTLAIRMERASANALALATALEVHPAVHRVYYPGLASHPDHAVAQRLLARGSGAIVSVALAGGYDAVQSMVRRLQLVRFVPSLGDVATTLSHPKVASHRELSPDEQEAVGIDGRVVRISVGIEQVADVIDDFYGALGKEAAS